MLVNLTKDEIDACTHAIGVAWNGGVSAWPGPFRTSSAQSASRKLIEAEKAFRSASSPTEDVMIIDGWTIDKSLYTATGPFDADGERRTVALLIKMRVGEPTRAQWRKALRDAIARDDGRT